MKKFAIIFLCLLPNLSFAENGLHLKITEGAIAPISIALAPSVATNNTARSIANNIIVTISNDLQSSGLFFEIPQAKHGSFIADFDAPLVFSQWKSIAAQALISSEVNLNGSRIEFKMRLFDLFSHKELGTGVQLQGNINSWRRIAHKIADVIYMRLTGERGYFDSRIIYIDERGSKNARQKRLAIMDSDGANVRYLTDGRSIVLSPQFSPNTREVVYTSYEKGWPRVFLLNVDTLARNVLDDKADMTFAPRFSPNGTQVVLSISLYGNSDLYLLDIKTKQKIRLTHTLAIETAPSFAPDGNHLVFESDRSGTPQIYIMNLKNNQTMRISYGEGRYSTPVWSPRGDKIAFTKMHAGQFHIGIMEIDGSGEKLLTTSFLDEGPTWSPNGRMIMFFRQTAGALGGPSLYSININGRNLRKVVTPGFASDPSWSALLN